MLKKSLVIGFSVVVAAGALSFMCPGKNCRGQINTFAAVNAQVQSDINVTAKSALLMEANSGKVLYSKDADKKLPIASMVKITTLAVIYDALERGDITMGEKVMVSRTASGMGGSQAFLDFDSEYTVEDLVKSIIIASANDSCVAMAERLEGSEEGFVARMNALAQKLGMTNTNYVNCTGLPAAGAYSTASDVAKVYAYIMKSPYYNYKSGEDSINKIWMYDLTHPSGRVTGLTNTNKHVRFFDGCVGGKTGFTAEAGHCITVASQRGSMKPIAVIIGGADSKTRFEESARLMNHVFGAYENRMIVDSTKSVGSVAVKKGIVDNVDVYAKENYYDLLKKGSSDAMPTVNIELKSDVKAAVKKGDVMGKIVVTDDGAVVREIDVVAGSDIRQATYFDSIKKVTKAYKL